MNARFMACVVTASCAWWAANPIPPAAADETVRAYLLVEAKPGQSQEAQQALTGLGNCLALPHSFMGDEIVVHLHCDGLRYLNMAVADSIARHAAVARVTVLTVLKGS